MTDQITRAQLVDELTAANEEADYYADRVVKLEAQQAVLLRLLTRWWAGTYINPYYTTLQRDTQIELAAIGDSNEPRRNDPTAIHQTMCDWNRAH